MPGGAYHISGSLPCEALHLLQSHCVKSIGLSRERVNINALFEAYNDKSVCLLTQQQKRRIVRV